MARGDETRRLASLGIYRIRASGKYKAGGSPQDAARAVWPRRGARVGSHRCPILRGGKRIVRGAAVGRKAINPSRLRLSGSKVGIAGTLFGEEPKTKGKTPELRKASPELTEFRNLGILAKASPEFSFPHCP